ncbi:MAG: class I SAM-dependent methyltransferase [Pirellulales bacterium]|nr:class I SAM-dependent methyltransferase [Pirellulales bacterium]
MTKISGESAIREAYRDDERVARYICDRYDSDPMGRSFCLRQGRILASTIRTLKPSSILEIAPGPARLTVYIPDVPKAVAIEQSPAMLAAAQKRLSEFGKSHWTLVEGDAFDMPFAEAEFDVVLAFKLLRHFNTFDRNRLARNIRRVLRPGGHFLVDVANEVANRWLYSKWGISEGWIDDFWYTPTSFHHEMTAQGFAVIRMLPVQVPISAQYHLFSRFGNRLKFLANGTSHLLNLLGKGEPLEWVAICRCE